MNILFRTDSSKKIGSGHLQRCLNLASILNKMGNKIFFICSNYSGNLNYLIKRKYPLKILSSKNEIKNKFNPLSIEDQKKDAMMTMKYAKKINIDFIVLDSYLFDYNWQSQVRKFMKLIFIDDLALKNDCDIYINYHLENKDIIKKNFLNKNTVKLLGMKNFIVNKKHLKLKNQSKSKKIYVYMGDIDSKNYSLKLLKLFLDKEFEKFTFKFILGSNYSLKKFFDNKYNYKKNISSIKRRLNSIWNIFNFKKDIIICSGGLIASEALHLNVRSILICQNNYQFKNLKSKYSIIYSNIKDINKKKILGNLDQLVKSKVLYNTRDNTSLIKNILSNV
tara:strand:- start:225 stop:1229 length:1005 start_codon:yes stop_codon:yes gene_type:complete